MFMYKLLIKLNIFVLLLILPLQGFAAASMMHCQMMNAGKITTSLMSAKLNTEASQTTQSEQISEPCHGTQMKTDKNTDEASNSICPHCYTCGIYSPALLPRLAPLSEQFDSHMVYHDIDSRFISYIPQRPLHPPSLL